MASNLNGSAYALTVLSPIRDGRTDQNLAYADVVRDRLQQWNFLDNSPMALVPNTYLCRYFVLDDVHLEALPGAGILDNLTDLLPAVPDPVRRWALPAQDQLKSRYLVFSANAHVGPEGDIDAWLRGMWDAIAPRIREVWGWCYGFDQVHDGAGFAAYIRRCQLPPALYFVGSNDDPLPEQLKALYLKQEFAHFAVASQGLPPTALRQAMRAFLQRTAPTAVAGPTWAAGRYSA